MSDRPTRPPSVVRAICTHLVVALLQGLLRESLPALGPVNGLSGLQRDIQVTTFDRKIETRVFVLDEVQRDL